MFWGWLESHLPQRIRDETIAGVRGGGCTIQPLPGVIVEEGAPSRLGVCLAPCWAYWKARGRPVVNAGESTQRRHQHNRGPALLWPRVRVDESGPGQASAQATQQASNHPRTHANPPRFFETRLSCMLFVFFRACSSRCWEWYRADRRWRRRGWPPRAETRQTERRGPGSSSSAQPTKRYVRMLSVGGLDVFCLVCPREISRKFQGNFKKICALAHSFWGFLSVLFLTPPSWGMRLFCWGIDREMFHVGYVLGLASREGQCSSCGGVAHTPCAPSCPLGHLARPLRGRPCWSLCKGASTELCHVFFITFRGRARCRSGKRWATRPSSCGTGSPWPPWLTTRSCCNRAPPAGRPGSWKSTYPEIRH